MSRLRSISTLALCAATGFAVAAEPAAAKRGLGPLPLLGYNDNFNRFEPADFEETDEGTVPLVQLPTPPIEPDSPVDLPIVGGGQEEEEPDPEPEPDAEPLRAELIRDAHTGGADVVRYVVPWLRVERQQGVYDWTVEDETYDLVLEAGLRPLIVITTAPCWTHPSVACGHEAYKSIRPDPDHLEAFGRFTRAVAKRYPQAVALEIWNESNAKVFWGPDPSPRAYRDLLASAWRHTRELTPVPPILFNGLLPDKRADRFLGRSFKRLGAKEISDATAIHPYVGRKKPKAVKQRIAKTRKLLRKARAPRRVWITEVGWTTHPEAKVGVSKQQQAAYVKRVERISRKQRVKALIIHRLRDVDEPSPFEAGLGAQELDGTAKPLYCSLVARHRPATPAPRGC